MYHYFYFKYLEDCDFTEKIPEKLEENLTLHDVLDIKFSDFDTGNGNFDEFYEVFEYTYTSNIRRSNFIVFNNGIDIHEDTLNKMKNDHPPFRDLFRLINKDFISNNKYPNSNAVLINNSDFKQKIKNLSKYILDFDIDKIDDITISRHLDLMRFFIFYTIKTCERHGNRAILSQTI